AVAPVDTAPRTSDDRMPSPSRRCMTSALRCVVWLVFPGLLLTNPAIRHASVAAAPEPAGVVPRAAAPRVPTARARPRQRPLVRGVPGRARRVWDESPVEYERKYALVAKASTRPRDRGSFAKRKGGMLG